MIELVLVAWCISAVLLFLPVGSVGRVLQRRLGLAGAGAAQPAWSTGAMGEQSEEPAPAERGEPAERPADGHERSRLSGALRRLRRFQWAGTLALYIIFVGGAIYLAPRLLARALDTAHPMAAVTSESMYPTLKRGDLVFIRGVDKPEDLNVGDIIAFEDPSGFAIHRIVELEGSLITTKGDANQDADQPIVFDDVIGRTMEVSGRLAKIPYVGNIPLFFRGTSEVGDQGVPPVTYEGLEDQEAPSN